MIGHYPRRDGKYRICWLDDALVHCLVRAAEALVQAFRIVSRGEISTKCPMLSAQACRYLRSSKKVNRDGIRPLMNTALIQIISRSCEVNALKIWPLRSWPRRSWASSLEDPGAFQLQGFHCDLVDFLHRSSIVTQEPVPATLMCLR